MSKPIQSPEVTPGKSTLTVTLSSKHPGTRHIDTEPTQIFPKKKGEFFPDTPTASNVTSTKSVASTKTKVAPLPPVTPTHQETATSVSKTETQKFRTNEPSQNAPKGSNSTPQGAAAKGKTRIRAGCINARASFWEKRIHGEETKEEEFPEMVENVSD